MKLNKRTKAMLKVASSADKNAIKKASALLLRFDIISPLKASTVERTIR